MSNSPTPTPSTSLGSVQEESKASPRPPPRVIPPASSSSGRSGRPPTKSRNQIPTPPTCSLNETRPGQERPKIKGPKNPVEQVIDLDQPPLPSPKVPSKCPLFCCFYAEFDIIVGPKICFQSPRHFMDHDIGISTDQVHKILADAFQDIHPLQSDNTKTSSKNSQSSSNENSADTKTSNESDKTSNDEETTIKSIPPNPDEVSSSIFDSTSEYIITGNELAGKMICLSTHQFHIMTRPTVIVNERYERNALLFCVGFVLRRAEDPRPFRPLLSKWAMALRSMEVESQFLTKETLRPRLQPMLERLLVSLNSSRRECNLLLDSGNPLNLKLFRPPKPPALPVPDHKVPVLLRKDWQFQMYDWDLAINWVVLHIDGVRHARWISKKSEVDIEMVRACLRVLKHHGVISLVDIFFYSNRYECTDRAAAMLAGKEPKLLQDAFDFVIKRGHLEYQSGLSDSNHSGAPSNQGPSSSIGRPFSPQTFSSSFPPTPTPGSGQDGSLKDGPVDIHIASRLRRQQKKLKAALAEMYCSCNRTLSFGDLWILKTTESKPLVSQAAQNRDSAAISEHATDRYWSSTSQPLNGRTVRSLPEDQGLLNNYRDWDPNGTDLGSRREVNQASTRTRDPKNAIDWKEAFKHFDHRRFAIFGVAHGLLRRVHCYPLVYDIGGANSPEPENSAESQAFMLPKENLRATSDGNEISKKSSKASLQEHRGGAISTRTKGESNERNSDDLVAAVTSSMDGTRCDDELVCMFEKPLDALIDMVKRAGNKGVVSTYSVAELDK